MIINSENKRVFQTCLFVLIAIIVLGIGYAAISNISLFINSTRAVASVNQENFKVHFIEAKNITGTSGVGGTSIIEEDDTVASFDVTGLSKIGDYAEAKYIIKNDSNDIGAEITLEITNSNSEYFKITETIDDNKIQVGELTLATIRIEMIKTPIGNSESTNITAKIIANPLENYLATGGKPISKISGESDSFENDSWATIKANVQNGTTSQYNIGDTKTVTINNIDYIVRLVNKSTNEKCSNTNYSETACGFVVEFVDVITTMKLSDTNSNIGGYPATIVYNYLNNILYGQIPRDLQTAMKQTRVISGYGGNGIDSTNFITTDNLYLLSGVEIHGEDKYDSASSTTTQLDYYIGMTSEEFELYGGYIANRYPRAIKQYQGNEQWYLLRPARSVNRAAFNCIRYYGDLDDCAPITAGGVAPAFRIG